jgi:hypothetical protein
VVEVGWVERTVGQHEAAVVERGASGEPFGGGFGADEREQAHAGQDSLAVGAANAHCAQRRVTVEAARPGIDRRSGTRLDIFWAS